MEQKTSIKTILVGLVILVIGGGVAMGAYAMNVTYEKKNEDLRKKLQPTSIPVIPTNQPSVIPVVENRPTIVIEKEAMMPGVERSELQSKIIKPVIDYYAEAGQGKLESVNVVINTQANKASYPYLGEVILEGGVKIGLVIEKSGQGLKMWKPEIQ